MHHRRLVVFALFVALVLAASARAQENRDPIPLKDWAVPFEQIRVKVMETQPRRIAERPLHPSVNAVPSAASHFITIVPCRVVDTRLANGTYGGPKLVGGTSRSFAIPAGPCAGIPVAAAYSLNLTVTQPEADNGFLKAYPTGSAQPLVSSLNFNTNDTKGNAAIVPADGTGSIDIFSNVTTHLIIDINGYFAEGVVISLTAGTGLTGGGTGNVTLGLAPGGVSATQLAGNSVSTGALQDNAVTASKIASGQVVKDVNGLKDSVTIVGSGAATVSTVGNTITVDSSPRSGSVLFGPPGDTTLIAAGYTEIGASSLDGWRPTAAVGAPSARYLLSAVWTGTKMIVWGGTTDETATFFNTGGLYDPATNTWSATSTTGAPSPRHYHTAVWTNTKMIVWGGKDATTYKNDGGQYDPATNAWAPTSTTGAPIGRYIHVAVWTGTKMIVWGGRSPALENTGGQYDPAADTWTLTATASAPTNRYDHRAVWAGSPVNKMIVWGGYDSVNWLNTGGQYDPATNLWTATSITLAPLGRSVHSAIWTGSRMVIWGGYVPSLGQSNTGGLYDPVGNAWTATSTVSAPVGRERHSAIWTGIRMIIWGGFTAVGAVEKSGGIYDPVANIWLQATNLTGAPSGRYDHRAVWTGSRMIVWGGANLTQPLDTGGQWSFLSYYQKN